MNTVAFNSWQKHLATFTPLLCGILLLLVGLADNDIYGWREPVLQAIKINPNHPTYSDGIFREPLWPYLVCMVAGILVTLIWALKKKSCENFYRGLMTFRIQTYIVLLVIILVLVNLFDNILPRRLVFASVSVHLLIAFWPAIFRSFPKVPLHTGITFVFLGVTLICMVLPGAFFPPFFNGIAGWSFHVDRGAPIKLTGLQFVRDDGERIWLSPGIFGNIAFIHKIFVRARREPDDKLKELPPALFALYESRYPLLKKGLFPVNKYFGKWAYPGHNLYKMLAYKDFPPQRIAKLEYVQEVYDVQTKDLTKRLVIFEYNPHTHFFIRHHNPVSLTHGK